MVPLLLKNRRITRYRRLVGDEHVYIEKLTAYDLGYRAGLNKGFSLDFTAFYNNYDHLLSTRAGSTFFELTSPLPDLRFPRYFRNVFSDGNCGVGIPHRISNRLASGSYNSRVSICGQDRNNESGVRRTEFQVFKLENERQLETGCMALLRR